MTLRSRPNLLEEQNLYHLYFVQVPSNRKKSLAVRVMFWCFFFPVLFQFDPMMQRFFSMKSVTFEFFKPTVSSGIASILCVLVPIFGTAFYVKKKRVRGLLNYSVVSSSRLFVSILDFKSIFHYYLVSNQFFDSKSILHFKLAFSFWSDIRFHSVLHTVYVKYFFLYHIFEIFRLKSITRLSFLLNFIKAHLSVFCIRRKRIWRR